MNSWMFRRVLVFMSCEDSTNHAIISLLTDCWSSLTQEWLLSMRQSIPDLPLCWHQRIGRNVREKTRPATIAMNRNNERVINRFEPRFDFTWKSWWNRDFREMSCCSVDWLYTQYMHANMQPSTEYRVPSTEDRDPVTDNDYVRSVTFSIWMNIEWFVALSPHNKFILCSRSTCQPPKAESW